MNKIDGGTLRAMFYSGAANLQKERDLIDKLNVFPVPDGDTGTNMSMTISSAVEELERTSSDSLENIGKAVSRGALMGARGNSGVILSQILRGFAKALEGKTALSTADFAEALMSGSNVAYKAVIKPVEGTILTVCRETAEQAVKIAADEEDMGVFLKLVTEQAGKSLGRAPELLRALKEAGVVDSGGRGFLSFIDGMMKSYVGNPVQKGEQADNENFEELMKRDVHTYTGEITYGYCTEFFLMTYDISAEDFRKEIEDMGDSMVVVGDEGIIKIHIHTEHPGEVFEKAMKHGMLDKMKVENMRLQQKRMLESVKSVKKLPYGTISVAIGSGIKKIMTDLNVTEIIEGGQTMNPSTEDFIKAIERINSDNIYIFPNNSNIFMAANQAADLSKKNVAVIATKNISQAISALIGINENTSMEENVEELNNIISTVKEVEVTYAVRDTVNGDKKIKQGDIIGLCGKQILANGSNVNTVVKETIKDAHDENIGIITLYYGEDIKEDDAQKLAAELSNIYKEDDVEVYYGGQPLYYYYIAME